MTLGLPTNASEGRRILFHMSQCSSGALHGKSSSEGAAGTMARQFSRLTPREGASAGLAQAGIQTTSSVHPLRRSRASTRRMTAFSFFDEDLPFENAPTHTRESDNTTIRLFWTPCFTIFRIDNMIARASSTLMWAARRTEAAGEGAAAPSADRANAGQRPAMEDTRWPSGSAVQNGRVFGCDTLL